MTVDIKYSTIKAIGLLIHIIYNKESC